MFGDADQPHPALCYGRARVYALPVPTLERHPRRGWRVPHQIATTLAHLTARGLLALLDDSGAPWKQMRMTTLRARLDYLSALGDDAVCVPGLLDAAPLEDRRTAIAALDLEADVETHGLAGAAARHGWSLDDAADAVRTVRGIRAQLDAERLRTVTVTQTTEVPDGVA